MLGVRLKGTHLYAAEYDSTKAAIDTVEARIRNHKGRLDAICDRLTALEAKASYKKIDALERRINTLMGSITALEERTENIVTLISDKEYDFGQHIIKVWDRLTALEDARDTWLDIRSILEGRITALEDRITKAPRILGPLDDELYQRVTALEAKDAPEKFIPCWDCTYDPVCTLADRLRRGCMNGLRKQEQPPSTCGNCKKAARWDSQSTFVVCCAQTQELEFRRVDTPGCSRHKRREEA